MCFNKQNTGFVPERGEFMENQNINSTPEKKKLPAWAVVVITLVAVFIILPISCTA